MLFHLDFHVEYGATMSQQDLFATWSREAEAALGAKQAGVVVDLWKVAGERRVIAIVDVDSHDTLDEILADPPDHGRDGPARDDQRVGAAPLRGLRRQRHQAAAELTAQRQPSSGARWVSTLSTTWAL